jgi:hypothetical protein
MSDSKPSANLRRRGFLLAGSVGAAGAVAVAVAPAIKSVAPVATKVAPEGAGYTGGQRAQQYYDTTRV